MKKEKSLSVATEPELKLEPKPSYKTFIFAFYEYDGEKGFTQFTDKVEFDAWLEKTNARVLRVVRGTEKKMRQKLVFV